MFACCVWRVCVPFFVFCLLFLVNDLNFTLVLLIHVKNHSSFSHYRLYYHYHHDNHFILFNTTSDWGRIQQLNSSGMVYPYPLITLGKPQGKYYFYFYFIFFFFCKLFFVDHHWGVDVLFHIYHITSFNYDAKVAKNVGLSCRCHMSNSQIVSSV